MSHARLLPPHRRASTAEAPARGPQRLAARDAEIPAQSTGVGVPHVVAFCALWLAIVVWAIPIAGTLLARQTYTLSTGVVSAVVHRTVGPHALWQVGVQADAGDAHATAMRATISTRLPERVAAGTTNYYWVGSYLADGSFIQAGYYVPAYAPDSAGWFYCAFTRDGVKGPCVYGPLGSIAGPSAAHTYALASAPRPDGQAMWSASLDGQPIGSFAWSADETGTAAPAVYAESSAVRPQAAASILGPITVAGFAIRPRGERSYRPVRAVYPTYSAGDVCPPYGVRALGGNRAALGSGLECPNPLVAL